MKASPKPWHSLFRNRRGALCVVCCGLSFALVSILTTWSLCCVLDDWHLHPLPEGTVGLVAAFLGTQFFKYRDDRIADNPPPPAP